MRRGLPRTGCPMRRPRGRSGSRRVLLGLGLVVACWKVTLLHRAGTHRPEVTALLDRPVPAGMLERSATRMAGAAIFYIYSEACPYCAIDHDKVLRAARGLADPSPPFTAVRLGPTFAAATYWGDGGLPTPDHLVALSGIDADTLGIDGVPVVVVARRGHVVAAWKGLLRWGSTDLRRAIRCRLGNPLACGALYVRDTLRGARLL